MAYNWDKWNQQNGFNIKPQGSGFGSTNNPDSFNLGQDFNLGLNMGTLQLGSLALGAWNGITANKRAEAANQIARNQLNQNAEAFNINTGMQVATLNDEIGRYNAHVGGFLDESQRRDMFDADQFGKLSTYS